MQTSGQAVNVYGTKGSADSIKYIFVDLAGIMIFQPINQIGQPRDHPFGASHHIFADHFRMVAAWHKAGGVGAKSPDTYTIFYARCCHKSNPFSALCVSRGVFVALLATVQP